MADETAAAPPPRDTVVPPAPPAPPVAATANVSPDRSKVAPPADGARQRFTVELRPGETTIVSWKKLLRDAGVGRELVVADDPGAGNHRAVLALSVPSVAGELKNMPPPPNRFNAVIEKIERLYKGKESSDEEDLGDVPDDDQYDTGDSFIDDTELDEYFQVDKLQTKHTGYFVNRGRLEHVEPSSSLNVAPKKRKRKDPSNNYSERDGFHISKEVPIKMSNMRIKAAAQNAPPHGKNLSNSSKTPPFVDPHHEGKIVKSKTNDNTTYKKKAEVMSMNSENLFPAKLPSKDALSMPPESEDTDHQKSRDITLGDFARQTNIINEPSDAMHRVLRDKAFSSQTESQPKKLTHSETELGFSKVQRKERNNVTGFPDMKSSGSIYSTNGLHPSSTRQKEASTARLKGTALERAIRDLRKVVAECRPLDVTAQEADNSSQLAKRRLPQDIKTRLAKVARLSEKQSKISKDDIIDQIMGILGHIVQRKALKRHMKTMVEEGLSEKQQKADRFQHIKKDVNEMIRSRVALLKTKVVDNQDGIADDFQGVPSNGERRALIGKHIMDKALEDKICELYDLQIEGMDEDKGPQSRKLYAELADLWPSGYMDNFRIKEAIYRSKERKKLLHRQHKVHDEERMKRKRIASALRAEEGKQKGTPRIGQERAPTDPSAAHAIVPSVTGASAQPLALTPLKAEPALPTDYGANQGLKDHDRAVGVPTMSTEDRRMYKKKLKRPSDSEHGQVPRPRHPSSLDGQNNSATLKHGDDANAVNLQKPYLQQFCPRTNDQPS